MGRSDHGAGRQPSTAARLRPWGEKLDERSVQTGHGEGPEGKAGVVIIGELQAAPQGAGGPDHEDHSTTRRGRNRLHSND